MVDIALINPSFEVSYWGVEHAMPIFGRGAVTPPAALSLLAALTPPGHRLRLVDENVEPLDFDRLAQADVVGVTGLNVQRARMREILTELKRRGAFTVVGGAWVTVQEDYFGDLADAIFVGEAEATWPKFLEDLARGSPARRYEQSEPTDMTRVPVPRHDLLRMDRYVFGSVQFSRGCPFQCEFCDIIVTFGRRPRLKTSAQVLAELEALRRQGCRTVFVVDDNLIGNKREIKQVLREVAAWQRRRAYPLAMFTEASLDLAEDDELMRLMVDANLQAVFVGIESPNEDSLRETKKYQNVRPKAGSMVERVRRIQDAGLEVWCGMIVGFDSDDERIFDLQEQFIREARIVNASIGMLVAIPKTPLYDRLEEAGRLDERDPPPLGTNVKPLQMTQEELRDGYAGLVQRLYEPRAYFDRLDGLYLDDGFRFGQAEAEYRRRRPWRGAAAYAFEMIRVQILYRRLLRHVPDAELREEYRRRFDAARRRRRDPRALFVYLLKCAAHYHYHRLAAQLRDSTAATVNIGF